MRSFREEEGMNWMMGILAACLVYAVAVGGPVAVATNGAKPNKKAMEYASDCVWGAMQDGAYEGRTGAELGQYCVDAITVVMNATYEP